MTLLHPWWLAAYPAALLLWWLRPRGGTDHPVSALFLWRQVAPARRHRPTLAWQPAGVRIPLVILLLTLALAGPHLGTGTAPPHPGPPPQGGRELATDPSPPLRWWEGRGGGGAKPGEGGLGPSTRPVTLICDGPLPEFLHQFLKEIGAPCGAGSPWQLRVAPGDDPTPRPLLWDLGDPLLAGAPGIPGWARGASPVAAGPLDRVLARVDGAPAIVLRPTGPGEELVIGVDLAATGLRDDPALPLLLAHWVRAASAIPPPARPPEPAPEPLPGAWRWPAAAAITLLWLPIPRHRRWHLAATLPLAAALVAPTLVHGRGAGPRTLLLDISASARRVGRDRLVDLAEAALHGAASAAVVAVGERPELWVPAGTPAAAAIARLGPLLDAAPPTSHRSALDDGLAIALAATTAGDVVVVSDGRGPLPAAPPGRPIHAVLLAPESSRPEPVTLRLPPRAATGGAAVALFQVHGPPDAGVAVTWQAGAGAPLQQATATGPDGWGEARVALAPGVGGYRRISAQVDGAAPAAALVQEAGPIAVAVVSDAPLDLPPVPAGIRLERVAPVHLAARLDQAPPLAAILLDDAAAGRLGATTLARLAARVRRDGLGLLLLGTPQGMAGGGYDKSPLAPALPLLLDRPSGRAPVAVAVVLDRSGSMVEGTGAGLDLGIGAVLAVRRGLAPEDRWALFAFDVALHSIDPLGPPPDERHLATRLATLQGGGGTDPWRAVSEAARTLATAPEAVRHLVVITDGQIPPPPAEWRGPTLTGAAIALDLVQVGTMAPSPAAMALAATTGGQIYPVADAAALPATIAVAADPEEATGYRAGDRPYQPTGIPAPFAVGAGAVAGHCPTRMAPGGVEILRLAGGAPLLALGRHGLGRTACWTATGPELASRPDLWQGLLAWLAPPAAGDGLECTLYGATLRVSWNDAGATPPLPPGEGQGEGRTTNSPHSGDPIGPPPPGWGGGEGAWDEQRAGDTSRPGSLTHPAHPNPPPGGEGVAAPYCRIESPDGTTQTLALEPTGDVWSATTDLPAGGTYRVAITANPDGPAVAEQLVLLEPDPEWAVTPAAGKAALARLARVSGGRFVAAGTPLPPPPAEREPWHPHPPLLLLAGAVLLLSPRPAPFRR